jgi:hypothetical protein
LDRSLLPCFHACLHRWADETLESTTAATSVNDIPLSKSLVAIIRRASSVSGLPVGLMSLLYGSPDFFH